MDMKRTITLLLTALLLLSCLAGCGKTETPSGTGSKDTPNNAASIGGQPESGEAVRLQWWGAVAEESGPQEVVDSFNASHTDIQVEYVRYTNDDAGNTKLDMSLMASGDADVFVSYNDTYLQKRVDAGNALALNELLATAGIDPSEAFGAGVEAYLRDGKYYMLPACVSNDCILYNKQMFDDAGVAYPTVGWTYDEFMAAAEALTSDGVSGYYYPAWGAQPATDFAKRVLGSNWMYNEDGTGVNIDNDILRASFEGYMDRVARGIEVDFVDNSTQQMTPQDMLLQGKAAMVYGNWIVRYVNDTETYPHDFKVGFATVPTLDGSQKELYTSSYGDYMSINSKSEHPEEAMEFLKWYLEGGMAPMAKYGRIPGHSGFDRDSVVELAFGENADLYDMDEAKAVFMGLFDVSVRTITTASSEIDTVLNEEFEKAFAGEQTVDEAIANAQARAQVQFEDAQS